MYMYMSLSVALASSYAYDLYAHVHVSIHAPVALAMACFERRKVRSLSRVLHAHCPIELQLLVLRLGVVTFGTV